MSTEFLGLLAGGLILLSTLPQLWATMGKALRKEVDDQSVSRNVLMVVGNGLWVWYGILKSSLAICAMCGLNTILLSALVFFIVRSRRAKRKG